MVHRVSLPGEPRRQSLGVLPGRAQSSFRRPIALLEGGLQRDTVRFSGILDDLAENRVELADHRGRELLQQYNPSLSKQFLSVGHKSLSGFDVLLMVREQMAKTSWSNKGTDEKVIYVPDLLEKVYPPSLHEVGTQDIKAAILLLQKHDLAKWSEERNGNFIYFLGKGKDLAEILVNLEKKKRPPQVKTLPNALECRLETLKTLMLPGSSQLGTGWDLLQRLQTEEAKRSAVGRIFRGAVRPRQLINGSDDTQLTQDLERLLNEGLVERRRSFFLKREGWRLTSLGKYLLGKEDPVAACKITLAEVRTIIQFSIDRIQAEVQARYENLNADHQKFLDETSEETALEKDISATKTKLQTLQKQLDKAKKPAKQEELQRSLKEAAFKLQLLEKQHQAHHRILEQRAKALEKREMALDVFHHQANTLTGYLLDSLVRVETLTRAKTEEPHPLLGKAALWDDTPSLREVLERVLGVLEGGPAQTEGSLEETLRLKLEQIQAKTALMEVFQQVGIAPPKAEEEKATDKQAEEKQEALRPSTFPDLSSSDSLADFGGSRRR